MPADIKTLPESELMADRAACLKDIKVCEWALIIGVATYGRGESVQRRLGVNQEIVKVIDEELERRANTKQEA